MFFEVRCFGVTAGNLLGANSNNASFNTSTLKYETKRCGTAPVQVEVKLFEVKANMPPLQT